MIAADASTVIDWLKFGYIERADVAGLVKALADDELVLPPAVVTELLSFPLITTQLRGLIDHVRQLPVTEGYWLRAGASRRKLRMAGYKPKLPDTLIAQACIDADVPLLHHDAGFQRFADHCGLRLAT